MTANAGYFYLAAYSPDQLKVIPRPVDGLAKVGDCASVEDVLIGVSSLGYANFSASGLVPGYNPACFDTPVEPATWSRIKAGYGD